MRDIALMKMRSQLDIVTNDDLLLDDSLQTAIYLSLFTNARAGEEEAQDEMGGYWGDLVDDQGSMGSKLWLLSRAKPSAETLMLAEKYARESLGWLIDDGAALKLDVTASYDQKRSLQISVSIQKKNEAFRGIYAV